MTQFLAVFDSPKGERQCNIYNNWEEYYRDTFSPDCNKVFLLDMSKVKGKTYKEKKAYIEDQAIDYSNMMGEIHPISWSEIGVIDDFFERYGKRYGLLREFRGNAIC